MDDDPSELDEFDLSCANSIPLEVMALEIGFTGSVFSLCADNQEELY